MTLDYLEDERYYAQLEAKREDYFDELDRVGVTCSECGTVWDPIRHPATRTDPAWIERDTCPECGGDPL